MSTKSATLPTKSPDPNPIEASIYTSGLHMPSQSHIFQPKWTKSSKRKRYIIKSGKLPSAHSYGGYRASDHFRSVESVLANAESEATREHGSHGMEVTTFEQPDEVSPVEEHKCESGDCAECNNNDNNVDSDSDSQCNKATSSSSSSRTHYTLPLRDRAVSAPASGAGLSSTDQKLATKPSIPEDEHETERKPTAQDWTATINILSKLVGAMLADDDRGDARSGMGRV